jgi:hypothetical protein
MAELTEKLEAISKRLPGILLAQSGLQIAMEPFGSSAYGISTTQKTWDAARTTCQNAGGDLAAFEDADDREWDHVYAEGGFQEQGENLWCLK